MTRATAAAATLICMSFLLLVPASASAATGDTLLLGGASGFGGSFDGHWTSSVKLGSAGLNFGDSVHKSMDPSWGAMVHYDTGVQKYLALGGRLTFGGFINTQAANDDWSRNLLLNLDLAPRLRFAIPGKPVEIYGVVPFGLSLLFPSSDWHDQNNLDLDTGVTWNVAIMGGADFDLSDNLGVFVEAGWTYQNVAWSGKTTNGGSDVSLDGSYGQFGLNVGLKLPM